MDIDDLNWYMHFVFGDASRRAYYMEDLDDTRKLLISQAREHGMEPDDYLNYLKAKELLQQ